MPSSRTVHDLMRAFITGAMTEVRAVYAVLWGD